MDFNRLRIVARFPDKSVQTDHWAGFQMPRRRNRTIDRELAQGWLAEACSIPIQRKDREYGRRVRTFTTSSIKDASDRVENGQPDIG